MVYPFDCFYYDDKSFSAFSRLSVNIFRDTIDVTNLFFISAHCILMLNVIVSKWVKCDLSFECLCYMYFNVMVWDINKIFYLSIIFIWEEECGNFFHSLQKRHLPFRFVFKNYYCYLATLCHYFTEAKEFARLKGRPTDQIVRCWGWVFNNCLVNKYFITQ